MLDSNINSQLNDPDGPSRILTFSGNGLLAGGGIYLGGRNLGWRRVKAVTILSENISSILLTYIDIDDAYGIVNGVVDEDGNVTR